MTDHLLAYAAHLDREPECRCTEAEYGTDTLSCALHAETPEGRQWNLDHPDGVISDEELASMDAYAEDGAGVLWREISTAAAEQQDTEAWAYDWGRRVVHGVERAEALLDHPYTMRGTAYLTWRAQLVQVAATAIRAIRWFDELVPPLDDADGQAAAGREEGGKYPTTGPDLPLEGEPDAQSWRGARRATAGADGAGSEVR